MTIWILSLLLLASLGALGLRQGAIRVACSLIGIFVGALLAAPLGRLLKPVLPHIGISNPTLAWALAPVIVFIIIMILFKVGGALIHRKVEVHYKYNAGDLRTTLWTRLNHRLGLCLGIVNGSLYLILITFEIYALSYWTVQLATAETNPKMVTMVNRLGRDMESTGFSKVARAVDKLPNAYYETADIVGLVYNNSLLEARLSRYPAFLSLAERPEFQEIATDQQFAEMRQRQEPIMNVVNHPKTQAILHNKELLQTIWSTLTPDLKDLEAYLRTGISGKYGGEKILGRWNFDVSGAIGMMRKARPNTTSTQMQQVKRGLTAIYSRTSFIAGTDHQVFVRNFPLIKPPAAPQFVTLTGQWKDADDKYEITWTADGQTENLTGVIEGERLTISGTGATMAMGAGMVFSREE